MARRPKFGVSQPPWDTLNLGYSTGDDPTHVTANRERVCQALGYAPHALRFLRQVHGTELLVPGASWPTPDLEPPCGDALLTSEPELLIGIRTADCAPVLLAGPDGGTVAAAHAGWRGLAAGVVASAVDSLCRACGAPPSELVAAIGPAIGRDRYEVGGEVAGRFPGECRRPVGGGKWLLDLGYATELALRELGINQIDRSDECTHEEASRYFSYRRDGAATGRQAGLIAPRQRSGAGAGESKGVAQLSPSPRVGEGAGG